MSLSYVGGTAAVASSVALPSFTAGDIAVAFAYRDGFSTAPSLPASGWTSIAFSGANNNASRVGYRVLQTGDTTSGTWTNATEVQVHVLRGQHPTTPIGNNQPGGVSSNQISYTGFTLSDTSGSSWVLGMAGHRNATNVNTKAVSGMTTRSGSVVTLGAHTAEGVSTFATSNYTTTVNNIGGWRSYAVEVIASSPKSTGTARLGLAPGLDPGVDTDHEIRLRARVTSAVTGVLKARLYEGADARSEELTTTALTTSFADYALQVGTADAAGITSYNDLELRVYGYCANGDAGVFEIAEAVLAIPPPAAGESFGAASSSYALEAITDGVPVSASAKQTGVARLSLGGGFTPQTREDHTIQIRARNVTAARGTIRASVYEGANPRTDWLESGTLGTAFAGYDLAIGTAEAASISSYADLELRLYGFSSLGSADVYEVADVALIVPAAAGGDVSGMAVLSSITGIALGELYPPIYPGTAVYPQSLAAVLGTAAIAVAATHETDGQSVLPLSFGAMTDGSTPSTNRQGWATLATTTAVAAVGDLEAIGAAAIASTGTIEAASSGAASHSDSGTVSATSAIVVSGAASAPPTPPVYISYFDTLPDLLVAVAFDAEPTDPFPEWTDISPYVRTLSTRRGRQFELDRVETGELSTTLSNLDGRFSPENTGGPYGDLIPTRRVRVGMQWGTADPSDVFNGYLEGYPQEWPGLGADSVVRQRAVDGFLTLSMTKLVPGTTTLSQDIDAAATFITVASTAQPMPEVAPFTIRVDGEAMTVTAVEPGAYTVTRAAEQTDAVAHASGTVVYAEAVSFGSEYSDQRIRRVLEHIGLSASDYDLESGQTLLAASGNLAGQTPLEHINLVAETEGGKFFAAADGKLTFHSRHHAFRLELAPRATFGDGAGELPYQDVKVTHEQERIYNIVRIKSADGTIYEARDEASIADHFERVLEKDWPLADSNEAASAAYYLLKRYSRMQVRIPEMTVTGQHDPDTLWPYLLPLEIGQRFRVIRRPSVTSAYIEDAAIDKELIVEGIEHVLEPGRMETRLQLSLADTTHYWRLGIAGYSELGSTTRLVY